MADDTFFPETQWSLYNKPAHNYLQYNDEDMDSSCNLDPNSIFSAFKAKNPPWNKQDLFYRIGIKLDSYIGAPVLLLWIVWFCNSAKIDLAKQQMINILLDTGPLSEQE